MSRINRIMESWRAWRRWSAVDRGTDTGNAEASVDRALREGAPRNEGADVGGAMRGRVLSRILNESTGGVSVGSYRGVEVVRDRIGWVIGGCAVACVVLIGAVIAFRASVPVPPETLVSNHEVAPIEHAVVRETSTGVRVMDVPVSRIIYSVAGGPLEEEAQRLMSDVKRAATALQHRLPRLSFAEGSRAGGLPGM